MRMQYPIQLQQCTLLYYTYYIAVIELLPNFKHLLYRGMNRVNIARKIDYIIMVVANTRSNSYAFTFTSSGSAAGGEPVAAGSYVADGPGATPFSF